MILEVFKPSVDSREVSAQVLFMVVVEVVRLVIIYLEHRRFAVDFMVKLGIVATLREIVLRGVIKLSWRLGALLRLGDARLSDSGRIAANRAVENVHSTSLLLSGGKLRLIRRIICVSPLIAAVEGFPVRRGERPIVLQTLR